MNPQRPRILIVGAKGVVGRCVHEALQDSHCVITAGLEPPEGPDQLQLDLADTAALVSALRGLGPLDAVISTAGRARFGPPAQAMPASIDESIYGLGLHDKLMGQVNLALAARQVLRPGGSITLTSGTTSTEPVLGGAGSRRRHRTAAGLAAERGQPEPGGGYAGCGLRSIPRVRACQWPPRGTGLSALPDERNQWAGAARLRM